MEKRPSQKVHFFAKLREKNIYILQTTFKNYFLCDIWVYYRYQYKRSSTNKYNKYRYRCQFKKNQIRAANMQNKLESEATPDRGNNSLN